MSARKPSGFKVQESWLDWARSPFRSRHQSQVRDPFALPAFPKSVAPTDPKLAMDDALGGWGEGNWAYQSLAESFGGLYGGALTHFIGYPQLAVLAQKPEYRKAVETIATEMTRKWIKISSTNDGKQETGKDEDKTEKIAKLNDAFDRLHVRDVFREAAIHDGQFGRGHIFIELTGSIDNNDELKTPIGTGRDAASKTKIGDGSLKAIRTVEPVWVYPTGYNSTDPLKGDWYKPQHWLVMGRQVHASRLLTLVGREVPDLLKPVYSFGGLSLIQMMMPYVDRWEKTAKSISDLLRAFTIWVLKTDLSATTQSGEVERRVAFFNMVRDNHGTMLLNKDTEDFSNISAQLGTLDKLQAQAQEQMASIVSIPLVKFLGISPAGLNASSEGELRCFYDWIHAFQELLFAKPLDKIFAMIQLSEFGEIDPDLTYSFEPLWSLNEKEQAEVDEIRARTGQALIDSGAIDQMEERKRVAADPNSEYQDLDVDDMPAPPLQPDIDPNDEPDDDDPHPDMNGAAPHDHNEPGRPDGRRADA